MIRRIICLSALLFTLVLLTSNAHAKYIYEYFENIEPLLIERNYSEAKTNFDKLDKRVKNYSIKGNFLSNIFDDLIKYLKETDKIRQIIEDANRNPDKYKANTYSIAEKNCSGHDCKNTYISGLNNLLPKTLPFSKEFVKYINNLHKETFELFNKTNKHLVELDKLEKERIIEEREFIRKQQEEARKKKQEEESILRKAKEKKEKDMLNSEIIKIDKNAKNTGYEGYAELSIVNLIYITQKEGGLENYINKVFGCPKLKQTNCKKWYPKIKVIQVLDKGLLYSFSELNRNQYFSFIIYVEKEQGKIYQDGQSLDNSFHAFEGMFSYTTIAGVKKSVPAFRKVKF